MKGIFDHTLAFGAALALTLGTGSAALADDTEIFVGDFLDPGQPNVLFIMDTSGSMGGIVQSDLPYDPDTVYGGSCPQDRIYFSDDGRVPDCDDDDWFDAASLVCDAALVPLLTAGSFRDRTARWDRDRKAKKSKWKDLRKDSEQDLVECRTDYGVHGDGSSQTQLYPADKTSGPWTSNPRDGDAIDWDDFDFQTLFSANFVNYESNPGNKRQTRLDVVKEVTRDLLTTTSGINVGLMRFSRNGAGGPVIHAMESIEAARADMIDKIDDLTASGVTPLSETLYEALLYYAGAGVDYGISSTPTTSVSDSRRGDRYVSPIKKECQNNFVVLLTDGQPYGDGSADDKIRRLPDFFRATGQTRCSGNCLDEVAAFMNNRDLSLLDNDQTVDTYTIGFHTDQTLLSQTAERGNGKYFTADDTAGLTEAFSNIIEDILAKDVTFSAPAIAVNNFNRLTHRDELYYSLFRPLGTPHWEGNLKRYRLSTSEGEPVILDANDRPAVDSVTDTFLPDALSYWTPGTDPDGANVVKGGLRSRLTSDRPVYTMTGGNAVLSAAENRVHEDNSLLTASMLEVDAREREALIRWARGIDDDDEPRGILGDALHSVPVVLSYGGTVDNPDLTLYYTTNDGYLHAVDPLAGTAQDLEVFSFIPKELLPHLAVVSDPTANTPRKAYGLDGQMTVWIKNDDGDGVVDNGEKAFVYFGMRRGGSTYYAIDVSNRASPKLAWTIKGSDARFSELGQTWSEMTPAKVRLNGQDRHVLFFAGGYDVGQDGAGSARSDATGRAIYMVDAETGQRLWWAANAADHADADLPLAAMTNSIPSNLRVIDMNTDGYADRIYVGDTAAQVWRFDIDNFYHTGNADFASGGVIAAMGDSGNAGNRRFYYPPSVSLISDPHYGSFLSIAIGSGHRANPLGQNVADRFYMIRDPNVLAPAQNPVTGEPEYAVVLEGDLLDVTTDLNPDLSDLNASEGWMIDLDGGEKVLAAALTADQKVYFTTYTPGSSTTLSCSPSGAIGSARLYSVSITSGAPRLTPEQDPENPEWDPDDPTGGDGDPACAHRCEDTSGPIPPEPVLVFTDPEPDGGPDDDEDEDDTCQGLTQAGLVVGTTVHNPNICTAPVLTYWVNDGPQ